MKCNACWREVEGQAISTTCGHLLCIFQHPTFLFLLRNLMKPVDVDPSDDWTNMAMAGISPQIRILKKFYQLSADLKEIENLTKEKQELQEKFAEKSRQKRKLDEMYDKLRTEYDSLKRSAIQPANNLFPRAKPDLFAGMPNIMDNSNHLRQGMVFTPETPGRRDEMWAPAQRQRLTNSDTFEISGGSGHMGAPPVDPRPRKPAGPVFGAATNNPSAGLRNMLISPVKRPQLSRNRTNMFT
ncbi:hypothetical protein PR202_ga15186 [Eleusine coracana subsp. coracana]|uniref:Uncharacterized protein n=1 Tax=Eleusine coracana subsp. coracana TaxID=191504 RepID=A0AAV5CJI8_ELECO|nr:hypothetical protein PR202_ga15186 [Eleusine coracana subsp. coracana]